MASRARSLAGLGGGPRRVLLGLVERVGRVVELLIVVVVVVVSVEWVGCCCWVAAVAPSDGGGHESVAVGVVADGAGSSGLRVGARLEHRASANFKSIYAVLRC
jgi:hypothetical protein